MFLESTKKIPVYFRNKRSRGFSAYTGRVLKGPVLIGLFLYLGVTSAHTYKCEDIPSNIVVPDDTPYECDVFNVSDMSVEAVGASFTSAEALLSKSSLFSTLETVISTFSTEFPLKFNKETFSLSKLKSLLLILSFIP